MDFGAILGVALLVLLLAVALPIVIMLTRRAWLSRQGMFECALHNDKGASQHWSLGMARYNGEHLEWFRIFAFGLKPQLSFRRTATQALPSRDPDPAEAVLLYQGQRIVALESTPDFAERGTWELAMDGEALTAMLAWLEAAPPSLDRFTE